jgi:hypothetical protein
MQASKLVVWARFPFAYCERYSRRQFGEYITYYQVREDYLVLSVETLDETAAWQNAADRIQLGDFS